MALEAPESLGGGSFSDLYRELAGNGCESHNTLVPGTGYFLPSKNVFSILSQECQPMAARPSWITLNQNQTEPELPAPFPV